MQIAGGWDNGEGARNMENRATFVSLPYSKKVICESANKFGIIHNDKCATLRIYHARKQNSALTNTFTPYVKGS
jgi:hypothetical protein